jgi:hypothetical protein
MATGTLGTSARDYHTRQTHYVSRAFSVADVPGTSGSLKIGTIPANSVIVRAGHIMRAVFNAGTDNNFGAGTTVLGTQLAALASGGAALGLTSYTLAAGSALYPVVDTDVYLRYGLVGTAATAGTGVAFVEYVVP